MRATACFVAALIVLLIPPFPLRIQSQSVTAVRPASDSPMKQAIWNNDLSTVRRLLADGTDPLKSDTQGQMPFLVPWEWAILSSNNDALLLLLENVPKILPGVGTGDRRIAMAAGMNNIVATRELLKRGLPVDTLSFTGNGTTALMIAAAGGHTEVMKLLLEAGADPRVQDKRGDSPLMAAVRIGSLDAVNLLLKRGVDPNQRDIEGRTALMWAARTGRLDVVRALLAINADIQPSDTGGQNALMIASAKGHSAVVAALRARGASATASSAGKSRLTPRVAVEKSIPLLQRGAATWVERAGCGACHHRPMIERVTALARRHGFAVDEALAAVRASGRGRGRGVVANEESQPENEGPSVPALDLAWINYHFAEAGLPRDAAREVAAVALAQMQLSDGRWPHGPPRVPISGSPFVVTAAAARVLQMYGPPARASEIAAHIDRAKNWLAANTPKDTHDEVFRMLGLQWTRGDQSIVKRTADALKHEQNADGGWTQLRGMNSDPYVSGLVLVALHDVGMPVTDPVYRRGVDYLLRNQEPDGSWLVHTRAVPQNVYLESGFPHGKFQFISYAGSCWATMALIYAAQ